MHALTPPQVDYTLSLEAKCTLHPELGSSSSCKDYAICFAVKGLDDFRCLIGEQLLPPSLTRHS